MSRGLRRALVALFSAALGSVDGAAFAIDIAPHRAVYEMSLDHAKGNSDIAGVSGLMTFEWADACDGWTTNQRTAMTFSYTSGEEVRIGWTMATWEAKDGLRYRFIVRQLQSGAFTDEFRGEARLDGRGLPGVARYSAPREYRVELPAGTLFPTAHSEELLRRAAAGDAFMWATVFDGSDESGLFGINAVISGLPRRAGAREPAAVRSPLTGGPAWHVALAYFAATGQAAEPEHEQGADIHDNGVVDYLLLDYGDFRVTARLSEIEPLPRPGC